MQIDAHHLRGSTDVCVCDNSILEDSSLFAVGNMDRGDTSACMRHSGTAGNVEFRIACFATFTACTVG